MQAITGQVFEAFYDDAAGRTFANMEFIDCSFFSCGFSIGNDPARRSVASNVRMHRCTVRGTSVNGAIVRDVVIDGLKTVGLFQVWGAVFQRVVLRGKIGRIMLSEFLPSGVESPQVQVAFDAANRAFYQQVDWAIDISEGEFEECDLRGVPSHLVRRDPNTQVVVKRTKALEGRWRDLNLEGTYWVAALDLLMSRETEDVVLIACKRHKNFKRHLEGLNLLREAGVAEWD